VDAFKAGALPILQRILLLATDATMEIKKRGMEPDGGGEIYFSCEPVKYTKPIQVRLILFLIILINCILFPVLYLAYS
jgi:RNA 3'-terminal phosphate cyclase